MLLPVNGDTKPSSHYLDKEVFAIAPDEASIPDRVPVAYLIHLYYRSNVYFPK